MIQLKNPTLSRSFPAASGRKVIIQIPRWKLQLSNWKSWKMIKLIPYLMSCSLPFVGGWRQVFISSVLVFFVSVCGGLLHLHMLSNLSVPKSWVSSIRLGSRHWEQKYFLEFKQFDVFSIGLIWLNFMSCLLLCYSMLYRPSIVVTRKFGCGGGIMWRIRSPPHRPITRMAWTSNSQLETRYITVGKEQTVCRI